MVTKMNCMVIQSLHSQRDQIAIQKNENENVVEEELMLLNDAGQFHIPKQIIYHVKNTQDKGVAYKVQDIVYNNYGTSKNIYW